MRGHLEPLLDYFTNLKKYLHLHTIGQDDFTSCMWSEAREKERYTEVAKFIKSVSSTLTARVFELGIEAEVDQAISCRDYCRGHQVGRPMDTYFLSCILPILIRGSWPKLKSLPLCSTGGRIRVCGPSMSVGPRAWEPEDYGIFESVEDQVRIAPR